MGLLDTLRSLLGLSTDERRGGDDGTVRVEHDPASADERTGEEAAPTASPAGERVDDPETAEATPPTDTPVDPGAGGADGGADADADDESDVGDTREEAAATGTDAAASTASLVDEHVDDPESAAEPPEATPPADTPVDPEAGGAVESDAGVDVEVGSETENDGGAEGEDDSETEMEDDSDAGTAETSDPVETVRGIGPAYGTRLGDVGVETVADLAAADPGDLARTISVAESRVDRWVARARGRKDE